jgi:hypothetical protein
MVLERTERARQQRVRQRTGNWMFFNLPLWNPEPLLQRHRGLIANAVNPFGRT